MPVPATRLQDKFLNLPMHQRIIGVGALIAIIGALLPWYSDVDKFNTGDTFLGVTGPLYLVGYIIIALSLFSVILTGMRAFDKKLPPLPMKESMVYIISGAFSLFLIVIANSVYTHHQFGINLIAKEQQLGMMIAFVGVLAVTLGGILQSRESGTSRMIKEFQEEAGEIGDQVLELNNFQKEQQANETRDHAGMLDLKEDKQKVEVEKESEYLAGREYKAKSSKDQSSDQSSKKMSFDEYKEKYQEPTVARNSSASGSYDKDKVNPNSVIRMDL